MKKFKILLTTLLCLVLCLSLCSCETWNNFKKAFIDPPQPEVRNIKIGVFEPLTGRQSYDAEDEIAGIELAHSLYPNALGFDIELIYEDNRSNADVCVTAAQTLINKGCCVVLGSVSDTLSLAASDVFKEARCPAIAITNTIPILTQTNPYYFRTSFINSFDAAGAADYVTNVLGETRCAVILQKDNDYELGKADQFADDVIKITGIDSFEVVEEYYDEDLMETITSTSFQPAVKYFYLDGTETSLQITNILMTLDMDGYYSIYSPSSEDLILPLIKASREYTFLPTPSDVKEEEQSEENEYEEYNENEEENENSSEENSDVPETKAFNWIGTDLWVNIDEKASELYGNSDFLKDVSYTIDYDPFAEQSAISVKFLNAFHEKFGNDATPSNAVALGFDAYLLAYNAILSSGMNAPDEPMDPETINQVLFDEEGVFNRERLKNKLHKIDNLQAVTGSISINQNGDPVKDIFIRQYNGKTFDVIYSVRPNFEVIETEQDLNTESEE